MSDHSTALEAARAWLGRVDTAIDLARYAELGDDRFVTGLASTIEAYADARVRDLLTLAARDRADADARVRELSAAGGRWKDAAIKIEAELDEMREERDDAIERAERAESEVRKALWLGHGHAAALYGDDGEMQCNACEPCGDYKRAPIADVAKASMNARVVEALERAALAVCWRCRCNVPLTDEFIFGERWHESTFDGPGSTRCAASAIRALIPRGGK